MSWRQFNPNSFLVETKILLQKYNRPWINILEEVQKEKKWLSLCCPRNNSVQKRNGSLFPCISSQGSKKKNTSKTRTWVDGKLFHASYAPRPHTRTHKIRIKSSSTKSNRAHSCTSLSLNRINISLLIIPFIHGKFWFKVPRPFQNKELSIQ